ncbi:MAG TPA: DUF2802 domain-containing protein [Steroidobacteraceae bacterium]|nr:DUF2802 domain-containing protein [Steroidobacteraceae bacterium]
MTVPSIDILLIAGRAVFLVFSFVIAAIAFNAWRRSAREQFAAVIAQHDIVLQRLADLESRIDATRVSVSQLGERIGAPQQLASTVASASPGYQIAIRLAKSGASREELTSQCGLSIHEAELVHRLHSPQGGARGRGGAPRTAGAQTNAA